MLTDRQSFILCAVVAFGFALSGMLNILNNFVVIAILSLMFIAVVVNIFKNKRFIDDDTFVEEAGDKEE